MKRKNIVRIKFITAIVVLAAFVLVARLYNVQIVHGTEYSDRADRQYVRPNQSLYDRGTIFLKDRQDRLVSGATLKTGFTLAVNPSVLNDHEVVYNKLNSLVDIDHDTFLLRTRDTTDPYEEIAQRVDSETGKKISQLRLDGVSAYKDRWRFYPGNSLSAQAIGFVAFDGDDLTGTYGLERYYNDVLSRDGDSISVNFFAEVFANLNDTLFSKSSGKAGDVVTSLEPSVQLFLERKLVEIQDTWDSKSSAGIIINPKNGEIYALAVVPTFDLNSFSGEQDVSIFSNPLVENIYEMGSIIKPLTVAAGLDSGAITPNTTYDDKGFIDVNGSRISNFDGEGRGVVPIQEILSQSLNTGVAFIAKKMGNDTFADYMRHFGLGEETGIDLPNESAGLITNLDSPRDIEYATASFGQGIAMTPIATVRALSALANGGTLVTPHLATEIKYRTGLSKKVSFNDGERVIKKETSEEITKMLVKVVDEALLGGSVKFENYSVAAKTGTAQIAKLNERGYYDDRYLHSLFGYFPAYDPEFLVFIITIEPKGVRYASNSLTHPFIDTVQFLANYYEVPPDR